MLNKEIGSDSYPVGAYIVARAAWIEQFGTVSSGGSREAPLQEMLQVETYNPNEVITNGILPDIKDGFLEAAKVYGKFIAVHFIGEKLGWNPMLTVVATTALLAGWPLLKRLVSNYRSRSS